MLVSTKQAQTQAGPTWQHTEGALHPSIRLGTEGLPSDSSGGTEFCKKRGMELKVDFRPSRA